MKKKKLSAGMIAEVNLAADLGQLVDVLVDKSDLLTKRYLLDAYTDYATGSINYNSVKYFYLFRLYKLISTLSCNI